MVQKNKFNEDVQRVDMAKRLKERLARKQEEKKEEKPLPKSEVKKSILVYQPQFKDMRPYSVIPPTHPVYKHYYGFAKQFVIAGGYPIAEFLSQHKADKFADRITYLPDGKEEPSDDSERVSN